MLRFAGILVVLCGIFALVLHHKPEASVRFKAQQKPDGIAFWHWHRDLHLSAEDEAALKAMNCDLIMEWRGEIYATKEANYEFRQHGGQIFGADDLARSSVLRLDMSCLQALRDPSCAPPLVDLVVRQTAIFGRNVQIDWDVPESLLGAYANWLEKLRTGLPAQTELSATGLVSWLGHKDLPAVAEQLDELFMQCYHLRPPARSADAVHTSPDPLSLLPQLEALPCAYRLGIANFEHCSVYDHQDRCLAAALPIAFDELLDIDAQVLRQQHSQEFICELALPHEARLAGSTFPAGTRFLLARPDPAWFADLYQRLSTAKTQGCRGLALFRLASPGSQPCLSLTRLKQAIQGNCRKASLSIDIIYSDAEARIQLTNPGDYDLEAGTQVLSISALPQCIASEALPPGSQLFPSYEGQAVSSLRATESLLVLGFLRAGTSLCVSVHMDHDKTLTVTRLATARMTPP